MAEGFPAGRNRKVQISLLVLLNAEVIRLKAAFTGKQNENDWKTVIKKVRSRNEKDTGTGVFFMNGILAMTYSHIANATLPSAQQHFTSVFGMGTGGSIAL